TSLRCSSEPLRYSTPVSCGQLVDQGVEPAHALEAKLHRLQPLAKRLRLADVERELAHPVAVVALNGVIGEVVEDAHGDVPGAPRQHRAIADEPPIRVRPEGLVQI